MISPPTTATYSLAHDENGREIILVSDNAAQRVCGLYVDADAPGGHRASGAIEGTSAMGVSGTRKGDGMLDTLVVCVDGTLALCIGTHLLCKLDATTPDGESTAGDVQFLSDSVGSGVTVHTRRRGAMRVRVPGSLASPHARALFAVLREVCSQDDFLDILRRMYASECVGADDAEAEWAYFVQVLQAWCEIAVKPSGCTRARRLGVFAAVAKGWCRFLERPNIGLECERDAGERRFGRRAHDLRSFESGFADTLHVKTIARVCDVVGRRDRND